MLVFQQTKYDLFSVIFYFSFISSKNDFNTLLTVATLVDKILVNLTSESSYAQQIHNIIIFNITESALSLYKRILCVRIMCWNHMEMHWSKGLGTLDVLFIQYI